MTGHRTAVEAVKAYLDLHQRMASCIARERINLGAAFGVNVSPYKPSVVPHRMTLHDGTPARLTSDARIAFGVRQRYRVVEMPGVRNLWAVAVVSYSYRIDDVRDQEILAYHWHPGSRSHIDRPHIHLGPGAVARAEPIRPPLGSERVGLRPDLGKAHLVSGIAALPEIIRMLIEEFGVQPRHPNWETILAAASSAPSA